MIDAIVEILIKFNWTYVSALHSEGIYGASAMRQVILANIANSRVDKVDLGEGRVDCLEHLLPGFGSVSFTCFGSISR